MTLPIFFKLLAIFIVVALGYVAGRMRWLEDDRPQAALPPPPEGDQSPGGAGSTWEREGADPARTLSNAAFYVFVPALLFRTTSRLPFSTLPWGTLVAFFVPVLLLLLGVYFWQRRLNRGGRLPTAAPSVRAISATFGNTLQVGVPMASALFGEAGLAIHITIISLHALTLLLVLTTLVEIDLARAHAVHHGHDLLRTLKTTLRNTIVHPVVLPVLAGMLWNAGGVTLPPVVDEALELLGTAVVPLCLVLIGMSLAYNFSPQSLRDGPPRGQPPGLGRPGAAAAGVRGVAQGALGMTLVKLLVLPALVLAIGHWGFGLHGLALNVVVMAAALPVGSNALIFSQRYETLEAEATAAIVFSTFGFVLSAPLWLTVLALPLWR